MFTIASGAAIARFLGPEGKGIVSLMTSFAMVTATAASLSLEGGLAYYLSRNKSWLRSTFSLAITFTLLLWGITAIFLLIFRNILTDTVLKGLSDYPFVLIIIFVGIIICNRLLVGLLQGLQFFRVLSIPKSVTSFLLFALLVVLYLTGQLSIPSALVVYALIPSVTLIVYMFNLLRAVWKSSRIKSDGIWKKVVTFGLKQHIGTILREVNYRLDYIILAFFLTMDQLGFYSVAVGMSELLWYIPTAIGLTVFPRIAEMDIMEGHDLARKTVRFTLILSVLVGVLFSLAGPILIKVVFGNRFMVSIAPFLILLPGAVAMATAKVVLTSLSGLGKPGYQSINAFLVLFISVFLSLNLIPQYGILGAAIAKSVGFLSALILSIIWLAKTTGVSFVDLLLPQKSDWEVVKRLFRKRYDTNS